LEELIKGKYVKKHSHVLFCMQMSLFSHTAVKLLLMLLNYLPIQKTWDQPNRSMWIVITAIEM